MVRRAILVRVFFADRLNRNVFAVDQVPGWLNRREIQMSKVVVLSIALAIVSAAVFTSYARRTVASEQNQPMPSLHKLMSGAPDLPQQSYAAF
jgi:hypothetical protein